MTQALHRQTPGVLISGCLTTQNHLYASGLALARFSFAGHVVAPSSTIEGQILCPHRAFRPVDGWQPFGAVRHWALAG